MTDATELWRALQQTAREVLDDATAKRFVQEIEARTGSFAPAEGEAVEVVTAEELDERRKADLANRLRGRYGDGTSVEFRREPAILGGYVLCTTDWLLDASVKGQLDRLTEGALGGTERVGPDASVEDTASRLVELATRLEPVVEWQRIGRVVHAGDSIARIRFGGNVAVGDVIEFLGHDFQPLVLGIASNIEERDIVGIALVGESEKLRLIEAGACVRMTGRVIDVPVGDGLIGRVVDALGGPIDGRGPLRGDVERRPIERIAPRVPERQNVCEPVLTGIKAIDSMIPIGRGQRELIIGDRQTGKTSLALDTVINQNDSDIVCIYVAIGQKRSQVAQIVDALEKRGAMAHTIVVAASASDSATTQYLAPYAGCAMGEEVMERGGHALIIYDDLTKHAWAYRQLALLLRRPPGREAYPGDVFYLHSRLLERAAKLSDERGGGSLTALPIVETQLSDVSAYIPTNIISITDGQIYLEPELFYAGIRPAVNAGLSVSRVGGDAQYKAMKQVAGKLRLDMAAYREIASFAQFGGDLDVATRRQLERGARLQEVLKQKRYEPMPFAAQVEILFAVTNDFADDVPVAEVADWVTALLAHLNATHPDIRRAIDERHEIDADLTARLSEAIAGFKAVHEPVPGA